MSDYVTLLNAAKDAAERYVTSLNERRVMPPDSVLTDILTRFKEPLPAQSCSAHEVLRQLDEFGSPATVATTGGRFFGFVTGGALPVTVAANWLATTWDQNAGSWLLSPIGAELEEVASAWLLDVLDLPRNAAVGFVTGSTMGTFSAILAARSAMFRRLGYNVKQSGLQGAPRLRILASADIHPTNLAAVTYAGFGMEQVEMCPVDREGRIIVDQMPSVDDRTILLVQAGNINSGSFDPFAEICKKARQAGAWVHVDGAFGLWARASRKYSHLTDGVDLADSWSVDGHKWLNLPLDSAVYICRDSEAVHDAFGVQATYLMHDERRQPNTFTPELSRRARGVEVWAALKHLGRSGVEDIINRCCSHAQFFAENLARAGYEVLNDVVLNQVAFACEDDDMTRAALDAIQNSGICWLGPTHWKGRFAMRISVTSWATTIGDVEQSLAVMVSAIKGAKAGAISER